MPPPPHARAAHAAYQQYGVTQTAVESCIHGIPTRACAACFQGRPVARSHVVGPPHDTNAADVVRHVRRIDAGLLDDVAPEKAEEAAADLLRELAPMPARGYEQGQRGTRQPVDDGYSDYAVEETPPPPPPPPLAAPRYYHDVSAQVSHAAQAEAAMQATPSYHEEPVAATQTSAPAVPPTPPQQPTPGYSSAGSAVQTPQVQTVDRGMLTSAVYPPPPPRPPMTMPPSPYVQRAPPPPPPQPRVCGHAERKEARRVRAEREAAQRRAAEAVAAADEDARQQRYLLDRRRTVVQAELLQKARGAAATAAAERRAAASCMAQAQEAQRMQTDDLNVVLGHIQQERVAAEQAAAYAAQQRHELDTAIRAADELRRGAERRFQYGNEVALHEVNKVATSTVQDRYVFFSFPPLFFRRLLSPAHVPHHSHPRRKRAEFAAQQAGNLVDSALSVLDVAKELPFPPFAQGRRPPPPPPPPQPQMQQPHITNSQLSAGGGSHASQQQDAAPPSTHSSKQFTADRSDMSDGPSPPSMSEHHQSAGYYGQTSMSTSLPSMHGPFGSTPSHPPASAAASAAASSKRSGAVAEGETVQAPHSTRVNTPQNPAGPPSGFPSTTAPALQQPQQRRSEAALVPLALESIPSGLPPNPALPSLPTSSVAAAAAAEPMPPGTGTQPPSPYRGTGVFPSGGSTAANLPPPPAGAAEAAAAAAAAAAYTRDYQVGVIDVPSMSSTLQPNDLLALVSEATSGVEVVGHVVVPPGGDGLSEESPPPPPGPPVVDAEAIEASMAEMVRRQAGIGAELQVRPADAA